MSGPVGPVRKGNHKPGRCKFIETHSSIDYIGLLYRFASTSSSCVWGVG